MPGMTAQYYSRPKGVPLRPDYSAAANAGATSLVRACTACLLAAGKTELGYPADIARKNWPHDSDVATIVKAASSPATTTSSAALLQTAVQDFLGVLGPASAGSQLLGRGLRFSFQQNSVLRIPSIVADATGVDFVGQASPIPVRQMLLGGITLEPRKFATISTFTGEIFAYSIPNLELVVRTVMQESVALALDSALLGTTAGDAIRPPGLRFGVSALPASSPAAGAAEAMIIDVSTLVEAIAPIALNSPIIFVAAPDRALRMRMRALQLPLEILGSAAVADDELVAVASNCIASAVDPRPRIDASTETVLHQEDVAPLQISTGPQGSATLATPSRSLFQTDVLALRLILECSWGVRHPSGVQWINNITAW